MYRYQNLFENHLNLSSLWRSVSSFVWLSHRQMPGIFYPYVGNIFQQLMRVERSFHNQMKSRVITISTE